MQEINDFVQNERMSLQDSSQITLSNNMKENKDQGFIKIKI